PGRITSHLKSSPESADELLRQLDAAFEQQIIEPAQLKDLRTVILDTVSSRKGLAAAGLRVPPSNSQQGNSQSQPMSHSGQQPEVTPDGTILASNRNRTGSSSQFPRGDGRVDISQGAPATGNTGTGGVISRSNIKIGTKLRDRFILDEVLGVGGMGTVY